MNLSVEHELKYWKLFELLVTHEILTSVTIVTTLAEKGAKSIFVQVDPTVALVTVPAEALLYFFVDCKNKSF